MKELRAKITSKGQITIPKEIREKIGLEPGREIYFEEKDGIFYIKKKIEKSPFDKWIGYLKNKKGQSPDEIIEKLRTK
jgi:AbrB family looped-hinge helix DNA binding protein